MKPNGQIRQAESQAVEKRIQTGISEIVDERELRLRVSDMALISFLLCLILLHCLNPNNAPDPVGRIGSVVLLFVAAVILLYFTGFARPKYRTTARIIVYMTVMSMVYKTMGGSIHLITDTWYDGVIIGFEHRIFAAHPTQWLYERSSVVLTELMMFGYVIYIALIPAAALLAYRHGGREGVERFLDDWILTNVVCYAGYMLLPVAGPSRMLEGFDLVSFQGYIFTDITEYMRSGVHLYGGAFPSAHCALATVVLVTLARCSKKFLYPAVPLVLLIYASTVYGWFHYVADVAAGILLAIGVMYLNARIVSGRNHYEGDRNYVR